MRNLLGLLGIDAEFAIGSTAVGASMLVVLVALQWA